MPVKIFASCALTCLGFLQDGAPRPIASEPPPVQPPTEAQSEPPRELPPPPEWLADVCCYWIDVPRFANGTKDNDPPGTRAWNQPLVPADAPYEAQFETADLPYGGDLQGVRNKLPYIRQLGFNAICLSRVFQTRTPASRLLADTWHVREEISLPTSPQGSAPPATGQNSWTPGDRLLLELVQDAKSMGMRVVLDTPFFLVNPTHVWHESNRPAAAEDLRRELQRWTVPSAADPRSKGPDAFLLSAILTFEVKGLTARISSDLMPDCSAAPVLLLPRGITSNKEDAQNNGGDGLPREWVYWIKTEGASTSAFARSLQPIARDSQRAAHTLQPIVDPFLRDGRITTLLRDQSASGLDAKAARIAADRSWRLLQAVRFCLSGGIMMAYGDEIGMTGEHSATSLSPMWWLEPGSKEPPSPDYRADFTALVRLMNRIRAAHEPLRRGNFEVVLADDARRVLAFARTYGDKQVIVVVNASNTRQEVEITAGVPGGLVGVMRPELEPLLPRSQQALVDPTKPVLIEPKLRIGGNRSIVDAAGKVRLNLDPMSLKLVLVGEDAGP